MLDLVYPPGLYCICCGKITDESRTYRLCNDCMGSMGWITGRRCEKCGRLLSDNDPGTLCFGCAGRGEILRAGSYEEHIAETTRGKREGLYRSVAGKEDYARLYSFDKEAAGARYTGRPHSFDKGHACASYNACAQALIFSFKYGGRSDIGETLGEILYDRMLSEYEADELAGMYDLVIPVPIHTDKLKRRGFNHAELMGRAFAKRAGLSFDPGVLIRTRKTRPMKGLGPEERRANIRGAFSIRKSRLPLIKGSRILLIDDIFTTGATIDEIAQLLKEPQSLPPARVDFLAFAAAGDIIL